VLGAVKVLRCAPPPLSRGLRTLTARSAPLASCGYVMTAD